MRRMTILVLLAACSAACGAQSAAAQKRSAPVAILLPGSGGAHPGDFLIRNKASIERAGIETVVTTSTSGAVAAANAAQQSGRRAVLVGMSLGTTHAASALASGAKVTGVVFVSGNYDDVIAILGSPAVLPRTLVVHHRADACRRTLPEAAERFVRWARGKASIRWITTSGESVGRECGARAAHGFFRKDGPAVSAIIGFVRSR